MGQVGTSFAGKSRKAAVAETLGQRLRAQSRDQQGDIVGIWTMGVPTQDFSRRADRGLGRGQHATGREAVGVERSMLTWLGANLFWDASPDVASWARARPADQTPSGTGRRERQPQAKETRLRRADAPSPKHHQQIFSCAITYFLGGALFSDCPAVTPGLGTGRNVGTHNLLHADLMGRLHSPSVLLLKNTCPYPSQPCRP